MLHFHDRATIAHALTLDLEPTLRRLLRERIAALGEDLIDWTEYLVIELSDTEADIIRHIGFSPLVEPVEGIRFGQQGFHPLWDWLTDHGGWFEMVVTFGSTFAYVLLIADDRSDCLELAEMCRRYSRDRFA